ncbi:MAG: ribosomal protein S18-alanine N-acetyltransferase [Suipraeoptans sp.]
MKTRKASRHDLIDIAKLEQEIFTDAWSIKSIEESYERKEALIAVCTSDVNELLGYFIVYFAAGEGEIERIAVKTEHRREGVGRNLLLLLEDYCDTHDIEKLYLEVRESNESAMLFYLEDGFENKGIRKGFYQNPKEDAIIMSRDLTG